MSDLEKAKESLRIDLGAAQGERAASLGAIIDRVQNAIRDALSKVDVSALPRADFLALVDNAYDQFILPIDLPGPDPLIDPLVKGIVLNFASKAYDRLAK